VSTEPHCGFFVRRNGPRYLDVSEMTKIAMSATIATKRSASRIRLLGFMAVSIAQDSAAFCKKPEGQRAFMKR
jgi:hypothetical protein